MCFRQKKWDMCVCVHSVLLWGGLLVDVQFGFGTICRRAKGRNQMFDIANGQRNVVVPKDVIKCLTL